MGGGGWEGRGKNPRQINYKTSSAAWGRRMRKEGEKTILFQLVRRSDTWQRRSHMTGDILRKETQRFKESRL